jgi:hypothetical protein
MKKLVTAVAIISVISLAGIQTASAHGGNYSNNYDYCGSYSTDDRTINEKDAEAIEKFRAETNSVRKEIVVKICLTLKQSWKPKQKKPASEVATPMTMALE